MNPQIALGLKPPATFEEQIVILKKRGLIIDDEDAALKTLQRINYYRLSAYGLSLKSNDRFHSGVTFTQIHAIYEFDHRLRYLIMDLTEQVEISFRTHISYHIAHTYGALGHLESSHFENENYHETFVTELNKEISRSQEIFIKHHFSKYEGNIPIWVAIEILSFGTLSKLYSNMKNEDKNYIAKNNYQAPAIYLESWLKCLSYVRNICAHYGRLYNRSFTSKPRLDHKSKKLRIKQNRIFAHLYVLKHLIPEQKKWNNFVIRLEALLNEYNDFIELERIGFPEDWEAILIKQKLN
ncbi:abortive infection bacteriophage resistance protein [Paenibacillus turicensis]|uniref:Abortive infection bacteriophage resistance protein n=1 Tax=Paenibacillus turicensis TaxID=160487 RepID=A0ABS4FNR6_9BACL|nr:Abi family protein [Paenibacillus turicensis]MBP1904218.1 abortive infection bacteriophage resistance protein [Paenibacillus turicensis]